MSIYSEKSRLLIESLNEKFGEYHLSKTSVHPVHTVYGGAQLFHRNTLKKIGEKGIALIKNYFSEPPYCTVLSGESDVPLNSEIRQQVIDQTINKLTVNPVEDYRIDFEDGYGLRDSAKEDEDAERCAIELSELFQKSDNSSAFQTGIRIKSFSLPTLQRSIRTFDIFLSTFFQNCDIQNVPFLSVCLPKVTDLKEVELLLSLLTDYAKSHNLNTGFLRAEIMLETPEFYLKSNGFAALREMVDSFSGSFNALHLGLYDFTSSLGVQSADQKYNHPYLDFLRFQTIMQFSKSTIRLVDGATMEMPVEKYKKSEFAELSEEECNANKIMIINAANAHTENIYHSMKMGFDSSWDLHPGQVAIRYLTLFTNYKKSFSAMRERFINFVENAARATVLNGQFDDAATGQGMLNYFIKGYRLGALSADDIRKTGFDIETLVKKSFAELISEQK